MPTPTITLELKEEETQRLADAWTDTAVQPSSPYIRYQFKPENCVITCYRSGKTVFQGKDAEVYAAAFRKSADSGHMVLPQAGSDEVGTGDYFGPVCVCACLITADDLKLLESYSIRDSKQLTDADIRRTAPILAEKLTHSLLIVPPRKYNSVHGLYNMNAVKSLLHNQAYVNLSGKTSLPAFMVIDQFTPEKSYYRYLSGEKQIIRNIHFETKAEDKYPAVGAASMIARDAFLRTMDQMESVYGMPFAKGAGPEADACAAEFIRQFGRDRLAEVAKIHFRNTAKLDGTI